MNKSKTDSWTTPKDFYKKLDLEFNFDDFDPCPVDYQEDGLQIEWKGNKIFVNPPYSNLKTTKKQGLGWVEKSHLECQKGKLIVLLIPARTDTQWFHEIILKNNYEVRFIKGRLKFGNTNDCAPFPSMLIIMKN